METTLMRQIHIIIATLNWVYLFPSLLTYYNMSATPHFSVCIVCIVCITSLCAFVCVCCVLVAQQREIWAFECWPSLTWSASLGTSDDLPTASWWLDTIFGFSAFRKVKHSTQSVLTRDRIWRLLYLCQLEYKTQQQSNFPPWWCPQIPLCYTTLVFSCQLIFTAVEATE